MNDAQVSSSRPIEVPAYLELDGDQVYHVIHEAVGEQRGVVAIAGPFADQRGRSYLRDVNWARTIASAGFDVVRFDYRGVGESTGTFEEMTFTHWRRDFDLCLEIAAGRGPGPLIVQGTATGALLAAAAFQEGTGDGLLLWDPPKSARDSIWKLLRGRLMEELILDPDGARRSREDCLRMLESGELLPVSGFLWSSGLWEDAAAHELVLPDDDEPRPWQVFDIVGRRISTKMKRDGPHRATIGADHSSLCSNLVIPECSALFEASLAWIDRCCTPVGSASP